MCSYLLHTLSPALVQQLHEVRIYDSFLSFVVLSLTYACLSHIFLCFLEDLFKEYSFFLLFFSTISTKFYLF